MLLPSRATFSLGAQGNSQTSNVSLRFPPDPLLTPAFTEMQWGRMKERQEEGTASFGQITLSAFQREPLVLVKTEIKEGVWWDAGSEPWGGVEKGDGPAPAWHGDAGADWSHLDMSSWLLRNSH